MNENSQETWHFSEPLRLELFSDAVFAIILTITVLEIKVPHDNSLQALLPLLPIFLAYVISFQTIGTYWNNHHHLLRVTRKVDARVMWSNLHLLFWLSLIPFASGWVGEYHDSPWPAAVYSFILLACALAYNILQRAIVTCQGKDSALAAALGNDLKGKISLGCYLLAVIVAFLSPWISYLLILWVSIMWFIPDQRVANNRQKISV